MAIEIRNRRLVASVVLILLGFCAGAGLSLLPNGSTVHGAPGDPNSALKNVAHDGTLGGDGTVSAPLGIANGGVSAPKLSAAAPPSLGQILGFNGANLAWQNAPASGGGIKVVDALGHDVGPFYSGGALRAIGGRTYILGVSPQGFLNDGPPVLYYPTANCSGPGYLVASEGSLIKFSETVGTKLYYGAEPYQLITVNSYNSDDGIHCLALGETELYGLAATFDLNSLGLLPPFHLEF